MKVSPSTIASLGLALASVLVAGAFIEIALRVLAIDVASFHSIAGFSIYDPELGWKLAPSRDAVFRGAHFMVHVSQNAEGLRDEHYDHARTPGRRRILVLGDSVVWCWGVEHDECFTERLERALRDTDVINTGVPGYSTAQELLFYEREGRRYGADVVLLVVAPNDADDNVDPRGPRFRLDAGELRFDHAPPPRRRAAATEWLQEHSRLFAWMGYVLTVARRSTRTAERTAPPAPRPAPTGGGTVAEEAPIPQPTPATWTLAEALFDRLRADVEADGARLVVMLEKMSERQRVWQRAFWGARNVPCLELAPALIAAEQRGEHVRLDGDPHLSAAGQVIATQELQRLLAPELEKLDSVPGL
jgi:hypothetical protein